MTSHASTSLLASDITQVVIRSFYDTYNELGPGFPEFVIRRALAIVIREAGLKADEEIYLPVWFHGRYIAKFKADLIVSDQVIVEVKVGLEIEPFHKAQVLHYLKAIDLEVGLLLHFGREPRVQRVVYQNSRKRRQFEPPAITELEDPEKIALASANMRVPLQSSRSAPIRVRFNRADPRKSASRFNQ